MKILHIIPDLQKGGAQRICLDICNELNNKPGIEVLLLNLYPLNEYENLSKNLKRVICGSRVYPSLSGKTIADLTDFKNIITKFKPDIIHSHLFEAEILSRFEVNANIKYITHCHDNMHQLENMSFKTFKEKKSITNFYEKKLLIKRYKKSHNRFIAISTDTHNYFTRVLPKSFSNRISHLPNAINFEKFFNPNTPEKKSKIKISSVGSLVDKKNQIFLIDVAKILRLRGIDFSIEIFGDGPNRNLISEKIEKENLKDVITLHGNIEAVEKHLHDSTLYVHPATYEPFGLAILEAMAAGLPVISLDGKGNRDIIENGVNGYIISQKNPLLFAEKIIELINNRDLFEKISNNAKLNAKKYDIKNYTEKLLQFYKQ